MTHQEPSTNASAEKSLILHQSNYLLPDLSLAPPPKHPGSSDGASQRGAGL